MKVEANIRCQLRCEVSAREELRSKQDVVVFLIVERAVNGRKVGRALQRLMLSDGSGEKVKDEVKSRRCW